MDLLNLLKDCEEKSGKKEYLIKYYRNKMIVSKRKIRKAKVINFGSTYAYYDFIYPKNVNGINLAGRPQYLDCDMKIVRKWMSYFRKGVKCLIVLPDFVFAANAEGKRKEYESYYGVYKHKEINVSIFQWTKINCKIFVKGLLHYKPRRQMLDPVIACEKRIKNWYQFPGVLSTTSKKMTEETKKNILYNISIMNEMIADIKKAGGEPYIIIPPVSEIMNKYVSKECIEAYLFKPIENRKDHSIQVLNYLYDEDFQSTKMYFNGDCLTEEGARVFTKNVLGKIGV